MKYFAVTLLATYFSLIHSFLLPHQLTYHVSSDTELSSWLHPNDYDDNKGKLNSMDSSRRSLVWQTLLSGAVATTVLATTTFPADFALASGGATAGKYTTIPIAKRRYYGRVQQAVHEFLLMGPYIVKGELSNPEVQHFFDVQGTVIVEAKRKDVNGQCTKKDNDCRGSEIRDSRWNDMKASMYLLGNAFRINQQKAPDNLPTVQAAKLFFRKVDGLEKLLTNKKNKNEPDASIASKVQGLYLDALDILDEYLDLVELPPTESGNYEQEFDTRVGATSRIT